MISKKLEPFGTSIFGEMTRLAQQHGAINLSQGFPDFDGPPEIFDAAYAAMKAGHNQYARSLGHPLLVQSIAEAQKHFYGLDYDAMAEVAVFCGATEGIAASMLGLLDPGDEAILFEPFYDSYPACVAMAGGTPRFYTLEFPDFRIDEHELMSLFTPRTRLLVINSPHNPTGKVFTRAELQLIARLCIERNVLVLADEVYEHLTYDDVRHVSIAALPGMRERTIRLSSTGKTFSLTGWKIGWATGPKELVAAAQAAHQFLTFAVSTPFQVAMAQALRGICENDYLARLRREYAERRIFLLEVLRDVGFRVAIPRGTYFILADFTPLFQGTDLEFARHLIEKVGVAAIPPSYFYTARPEAGQRVIRFAFCKRMSTLKEAAQRLERLKR